MAQRPPSYYLHTKAINDMKQFVKCCSSSSPEPVVSWSHGFGSLQIKQSGSGDECLPLPVCQFEFDGALISTQVACLILTLKPYDITHLFFGFKIICALTYVGKKASVEINLKLILTYKEKVVRNISRQFIFYSLAFR